MDGTLQGSDPPDDVRLRLREKFLPGRRGRSTRLNDGGLALSSHVAAPNIPSSLTQATEERFKTTCWATTLGKVYGSAVVESLQPCLKPPPRNRSFYQINLADTVFLGRLEAVRSANANSRPVWIDLALQDSLILRANRAPSLRPIVSHQLAPDVRLVAADHDKSIGPDHRGRTP